MRILFAVLLCFVYTKVNAASKSLNGYVINKSTGTAYRIMFQSQTWPVARYRCEVQGAKLAVPKTEEEFLFIQKLVRAMHYNSIDNTENRLLVWLGISNLDNYKVWKTIDGENLKDTKFNIWAEGNGEGYSDAVEEPHCVGLDAVNPGLRNYWCHLRQPYVCQLDLNR